tara:strand:- start:66 stop:302 length:237 start_codon:yes stop_codon:yes gene_type:complete
MKISPIYAVPYVNRYVEQERQYRKRQAPVYASEKNQYDHWETLTLVQSKMLYQWQKATGREKQQLQSYLKKEFRIEVA